MKYEERIGEKMDRWVVLGLDPSLSRTGVAILSVDATGESVFHHVGSLAPTNSAVESWLRSKAVGKYLADTLLPLPIPGEKTGLIISLEAPTVGNDYLITVSNIIKAVLFSSPKIHEYARIIFTHINAATLRSVMSLTKKGDNKDENIAKAYTFVDQMTYMGMDSDACDAVLMSMMGRWVISLLQGRPELVPMKAFKALTDETTDLKKRGRTTVEVMKGIMNNPRYWFEVDKSYDVSLTVRDARVPKGKRVHPVAVPM